MRTVVNTLLHPILGLGGWEAYVLVGALCFGEAAIFLGFVIPGETAVVLGGVLAAEHHVSLPAMVTLVVACAIAGDTVGYEVGRHLGPRLLQLRPLRANPNVERSRRFLQRRGPVAVFLGRFTAVFRALVPGIAGLSGLSYPRFALANAAGGIVWGAGFTLAGYAVGTGYEKVLRAAGTASTALIAAAALLLVGWFAWRRVRERRERAALRAGPEIRPTKSTFGAPAGKIGRRRHDSDDEENPMALQLGDPAPDFTADSTEGPIHLYEYLGDSWGILFSHPADFTPVCTTELGEVARLKGEFDKRNTKVLGLSVDPVSSHRDWAQDIKDATGHALNYPLIGDPERKVADLYGMIHPNANDTLTVRSVFIIGPDKKIKLTITYPASTGRNFQEILRVLDSLQLTSQYSVSTPVNWNDGEDVIIATAISDDEAKQRFPKGFRAVKPYLRYTPQPNR
ncbi:MAG TPA: redoxin domain-containing protein [Acidimicrobiales bacterium]|nr:redoxin domain-containing protein [Acidimicrobiales bacterium]